MADTSSIRVRLRDKNGNNAAVNDGSGLILHPEAELRDLVMSTGGGIVRNVNSMYLDPSSAWNSGLSAIAYSHFVPVSKVSSGSASTTYATSTMYGNMFTPDGAATVSELPGSTGYGTLVNEIELASRIRDVENADNAHVPTELAAAVALSGKEMTLSQGTCITISKGSTSATVAVNVQNGAIPPQNSAVQSRVPTEYSVRYTLDVMSNGIETNCSNYTTIISQNITSSGYATSNWVSSNFIRSGQTAAMPVFTSGVSLNVASNAVVVTSATSAVLGGVKIGASASTGLYRDTNGVLKVAMATYVPISNYGLNSAFAPAGVRVVSHAGIGLQAGNIFLNPATTAYVASSNVGGIGGVYLLNSITSSSPASDNHLPTESAIVQFVSEYVAASGGELKPADYVDSTGGQYYDSTFISLGGVRICQDRGISIDQYGAIRIDTAGYGEFGCVKLASNAGLRIDGSGDLGTIYDGPFAVQFDTSGANPAIVISGGAVIGTGGVMDTFSSATWSASDYTSGLTWEQGFNIFAHYGYQLTPEFTRSAGAEGERERYCCIAYVTPADSSGGTRTIRQLQHNDIYYTSYTSGGTGGAAYQFVSGLAEYNYVVSLTSATAASIGGVYLLNSITSTTTSANNRLPTASAIVRFVSTYVASHAPGGSGATYQFISGLSENLGTVTLLEAATDSRGGVLMANTVTSAESGAATVPSVSAVYNFVHGGYVSKTDYATTASAGIIVVGSGLTMSSTSKLTLNTASIVSSGVYTSTIGGVRIVSQGGIKFTSGNISLENAATTQLGGVTLTSVFNADAPGTANVLPTEKAIYNFVSDYTKNHGGGTYDGPFAVTYDSDGASATINGGYVKTPDNVLSATSRICSNIAVPVSTDSSTLVYLDYSIGYNCSKIAVVYDSAHTSSSDPLYGVPLASGCSGPYYAISAAVTTTPINGTPTVTSCWLTRATPDNIEYPAEVWTSGTISRYTPRWFLPQKNADIYTDTDCAITGGTVINYDYKLGIAEVVGGSTTTDGYFTGGSWLAGDWAPVEYDFIPVSRDDSGGIIESTVLDVPLYTWSRASNNPITTSTHNDWLTKLPTGIAFVTSGAWVRPVESSLITAAVSNRITNSAPLETVFYGTSKVPLAEITSGGQVIQHQYGDAVLPGEPFIDTEDFRIVRVTEYDATDTTKPIKYISGSGASALEYDRFMYYSHRWGYLVNSKLIVSGSALDSAHAFAGLVYGVPIRLTNRLFALPDPLAYTTATIDGSSYWASNGLPVVDLWKTISSGGRGCWLSEIAITYPETNGIHEVTYNAAGTSSSTAPTRARADGVYIPKGQANAQIWLNLYKDAYWHVEIDSKCLEDIGTKPTAYSVLLADIINGEVHRRHYGAIDVRGRWA